VEDHSDVSNQGRSLAIPVEYVRGVLEVKSQFSAKTVVDAIDHLNDLQPLMGSVDDAEERYKLHLPANFFCGLIFFELRTEHQHSEAALLKLISGASLRGFFGGLILRGEGVPLDASGKLSLVESETSMESTIKNTKGSLLAGFAMTGTNQVAEKIHLGAMLIWTETSFSQFAFDLVAVMQGTYEMGRLSSFYGMGGSEFG
jgi:hypothetical protein